MTNDSDTPTNALDPAFHPSILEVMVYRRPEPIGDVATSLWEALFTSLAVIIGHDGFNALYDRCLHQTGLTFPWLDPAEASPQNSLRFERLRSALETRRAEEAAKATIFLLATFTRDLGTLIGHQLTHHILRTAWGGAFDEATQEISQWPTK